MPVWLPLAALVALPGAWLVGADGLLPASVNLSASAATIQGRASVIDGDTIEIHGERIRLNGIDAAESRQICNDAKGRTYRCGAVAAQALADYLAGAMPTRCVASGRDQYRRHIATCYRADGQDVGGWMVRNGLALDWLRYSKGVYRAKQWAARWDERGLWAGSFEKPWNWRAAGR